MVSKLLPATVAAVKENPEGRVSFDDEPAVVTFQRRDFAASNRDTRRPVILSSFDNRILMYSALFNFAFRLPRYIALAVILIWSAGGVAAQAARPTPEPVAPRVSPSDDSDPMTSLEEEMRAKHAIKYAEKEYRENLDRAHELAALGTQLSEAFEKNHQFGREDLKKLDRLEKLTKAIRNAAGGSDSEKETDKARADFAATVKNMFGIIESLAGRVEKTPRHVISAAVIDEANVLLELIRSVRELSPKV